jgi:hypothetical protein
MKIQKYILAINFFLTEPGRTGARILRDKLIIYRHILKEVENGGGYKIVV